MPTDAVALIHRFYELSKEGDPGCWDLWDDGAVAVPPREFPEVAEIRGVDEIQRSFGEWRAAFGRGWWKGLGLDAVTELPDGRLLADITFKLAGGQSGVPVDQLAAVIYSVRNGIIVRAEHFMERAAARAAAGIE